MLMETKGPDGTLRMRRMIWICACCLTHLILKQSDPGIRISKDAFWHESAEAQSNLFLGHGSFGFK